MFFDVPEGGILLYPNPANDYIYLQLNNSRECLLFVYDITGNLINNIKSESYNGQVKIDLQNLQDGVYIVQMLLHDRNYCGKFVIKK